MPTLRRALRFPGFRPTALVLFSIIWASVGLAIYTRPEVTSAGHQLPLEYLTLEVRAGIWWLSAVCGIIAAFWPPGHDVWGWVALSIPASLRVASYTVGALFGWLDPTFAISWAVIIGILVLVACWPEPPTPGVAP